MRIKYAGLAVLSASLWLFTATALADDDACGNQTNVNDAITTAASWDILVSCPVTLSAGHTHRCVVTACADAAIPVGSVNNDYRFVVSTAAGGPGLDTGWERNIQLNDNAGDFDAGLPVCTVRQVTVGSGTVTFYWLARKAAATDANMTVTDSSLGVICTDGL
jgi:hypothetical protein